MRGYLFLAVTILCEVCGTTCMKLSHTSTRWLPLVLIPIFYAGTVTFMWLALRHLELGFVYAVWSGIGTAAAALIGISVFHESPTAAKIGCVALIVIGVVGLNLANHSSPSPTTTPIQPSAD
jgi:small multidrug resistance pump